jgi:sirohydrochlorin ferrochelatase
MKALLPVAHGSRRKQSNDEVIHLAEKLKNNCGDQYGIIKFAFLELVDILIPDGIDRSPCRKPYPFLPCNRKHG